MVLKIKNRDARRLWLSSHGLWRAPTGPLDVLKLIKNLGFVQLDSIRNVTRAHHHILWSRNQHYREPLLWALLAEDRALFEHFTHDASLIPMQFYPYWTRQFSRIEAKITNSWYGGTGLDTAGRAAIKQRIVKEGPLSTRAFDTKVVGKKEMWKRPPHKKALDYMWYCGELTTAYRENFIKFYDLTNKVVPADILERAVPDTQQIDWLCTGALERMSFGTQADIQKFWAATDRAEVSAWAQRSLSSGANAIIPVEIQSHDGSWTQGLACSDIEQRLAALKPPNARLRIINPFDPAIRDRARLMRLFGMEFKIEIFVPAAKRRWGYYVYPILEGDSFIARADIKADRKKGLLTVRNVWLEPCVQWSAARVKTFDAELSRLAKFIGAGEVRWECGRPDA